MRILFCGSRYWNATEPIELQLKELKEKYDGVLTIVHGAASGADKLAGKAAWRLGIKVEDYPADWVKYGKAAGVIRNTEMLSTGIDMVYAYSNDLDVSIGTKNMCDQAKKAGVPVFVTRIAFLTREL